jgi:lysophospholipase L1-like esterase
MKTILCYGDSNTWGYDPVTMTRFDMHTRWTGVLRDTLGAGYHVVEEGLGGRTTVQDDPFEPGRNGLTYLAPCYHSHRPLDVITIMLGTNDCKARFNVPPGDIAVGVQWLIRTVRHSAANVGLAAPQILIICPPPFAPLAPTMFAEMFAGGEEKSRQLAPHYAQVAAANNCAFMDAGQVMHSSPLDGIHFEADQHRLLGLAAVAKIHAMLGETSSSL